MKTAHLEVIGGLIRVFPEGKSFGDPYEYAITIRTLSHDKVEVLGTLTSPTPSQWRAIQECLKSNGFKAFVITRKRDDGSTEVREHIIK
jgi:hypothetical protein